MYGCVLASQDVKPEEFTVFICHLRIEPHQLIGGNQSTILESCQISLLRLSSKVQIFRRRLSKELWKSSVLEENWNS